MSKWKKRLLAFAPKEGVFLWVQFLLVLCGVYFLDEFVTLIAPHLSGSDLIKATAAGFLAISFISILGVVAYESFKRWILGIREYYVEKID